MTNWRPSVVKLAALPALGLASCLALACRTSSGDDTGVLSLVDVNDSLDIEDYLARLTSSGDTDYARRVEQAAAAVALIGDYCTGWLIAPRYVVTNQHCVVNDGNALSNTSQPFREFDASVCNDMTVTFGYQKAVGRAGSVPTVRRKFHCQRIVIARQAIDLALIELDQPVPESITPLVVARRPEWLDQPLAVIGHPAGEPQQISISNSVGGAAKPCVGLNTAYIPGKGPMDDPHPYERLKDSHSFAHNCDTRGGSSGSPVLHAKSLQVVGLHWSGWSVCKWAHYQKDGRLDDTNFRQGHGGSEAMDDFNRQADLVPYRPANLGIDIATIRTALLSRPLGDEAGALPRSVFEALEETNHKTQAQ